MWLWLTIKWLVVAVEVLVAVPTLYLAAVAAAAIARSFGAGREAPRGVDGAGEEARHPRFALVIPAHDEEATIGTLLASLGDVDYPRERFDIYVVADNCRDDTVGVVERSGVARALARVDTERRGKGYALAWAFERLRGHAPAYDAYVVIDADSVVDSQLLLAYARALRSRAAAIQASNAVLNVEESPATALRWIALTLMNHIRPLGRNLLGANSTLTGNGMCLSAGLLERQPWRAFGLAEDYQYYLTITLAGERIRYAPDARVRSVMPVSFEAMQTQDLRWESVGQRPPTWSWVARLLRAGGWRRIEAVLELIAPPLSQLVAVVVIADIAAPALRDPLAMGLAALLTLGLVVYVASAFITLRPAWPVYRALLSAPGFLAWKLWVTLVLRRRRSREGAWVRTARAQRL